MSWQFTPYTLFLLLAAGVVFGLAFLLRRHRDALGAGALAVMMLAAGLWDLGAGFELSAADHFYKVFWAKLQYLGIVAIPVAWLAFAIVSTGRESWLSRCNLALLCLVPAITLLLVATNEYHGLIWSQVELTRDEGIVDLYLEHGPAFWVNWSYSYLLLLAGTIMLVLTLFRSSLIYQMQGFVLLFAVSAPWIGNALYVFDLSPLGKKDLTPFAFVVCGAAVYYGISNLRILDIMPVARNAIFDYIKDGVVVIDPQGRVADVNSVARNIPELPRKNDDIHDWSLEMRSDLARIFKGESSHGELRLGDDAARATTRWSLTRCGIVATGPGAGSCCCGM